MKFQSENIILEVNKKHISKQEKFFFNGVACFLSGVAQLSYDPVVFDSANLLMKNASETMLEIIDKRGKSTDDFFSN